MHFTPMRIASTLIPLLASLLLSGCAAKVSFSKKNKASIRSVEVAHISQYPKEDEVVIYTIGQNLAGAFGGGLGALAAHAAAGDDRTRFQVTLRNQKIDPGLIIAQAFEQELARRPFLSLKKPADATFTTRVKVVGLMIPHGFSAALCPYLAVEAKLTRNDGKVIWQQTEWIRDGDTRHGGDEYMANPEVLRSALQTAAGRLAKDFIREMHEQSGTSYPE
jgi:hypothetical protein